jgi:hypothetical protein
MIDGVIERTLTFGALLSVLENVNIITKGL